MEEHCIDSNISQETLLIAQGIASFIGRITTLKSYLSARLTDASSILATSDDCAYKPVPILFSILPLTYYLEIL